MAQVSHQPKGLKKLDLSACDKEPGHADKRDINPGKDPDGSSRSSMQTKPLEEQSAQDANSENSASNRHKTIQVSGFCKSYPARFLIDSGATHNFVSLDYLRAHELDKLLYNDDEGSVTFGNDTTVESSAYGNLPI